MMKRFINYMEQLQKQKKVSKGYLYFAVFGILLTLAIALTLPNYFLSKTTEQQAKPVRAAGNTYYVDYSIGSDVNTGTSKTTPWKRAPGMGGFTGSYTHQAGDQFIFKGGVTWPASNFMMRVTNGGSSDLVRDYYGVDQTWYSGSTWSRPIFSAGGTFIAGAMVNIQADYITLDNIEFIGQYWTNDPPTYISLNAQDYITVQNAYFHGWSHDASGPDGLVAIFAQPGTAKRNNIADHILCDGFDVPGQDSGECTYYVSTVRYSTMRNMANANANGGFFIHDNNIGPISRSYDYPRTHGNGIQTSGGASVYNNFVHDVSGGAGENINFGTSAADNFFFNNVTWGWTGTTPPVQVDDRAYAGGNFYAYNNTIECNAQSCIKLGNGSGGSGLGLRTVILNNNHYINGGDYCTSVQDPINCGVITNFIPDTKRLSQTTAQATATGYTAANKYAPALLSSPTVDQGNSIICSGCGAAVNSDILNTLRPQGTTWDIGAYDYSGAISSPTPTPTGNPTLTPTNAPLPTATPTSAPTPTPTPTTPPIDIYAPTVSIAYPLNGATVTKGSTITISATATDNVAVQKVEFYVTNSLKCSANYPPYTCGSWNIPNAANKQYTITAKAYDTSGKTATSTVTVTAR